MSALESIDLIINIKEPTKQGRLVAFDSQGAGDAGQLLLRGEAPGINLRCVEPGTTTPWKDVDLEAARAANGVRLGLGEFDKAPDSGAWPLSYNGDSTGMTALDGNMTAAAFLGILNANPAISNDIANVTLKNRTYRIYFATTGAKHDFTTTADNNLLPLSSVSIARIVTGDADTKEVVAITVKRRPYVYCDTWTASPAAGVTCATTIAGSAVDPKADCVQTITLTPGCYAGRYSIPVVLPNTGTGGGGSNVTQAITFFATDDADAMLARFQTHPEVVKSGLSGVEVTGDPGGPYTVTFINHMGSLAIALMVPANLDLQAPRTLQGEFALDEDGIAAFFDAISGNTSTLTAELEIQAPGDTPAKPYQDLWTVGRDLFSADVMRPRTDASFPTNGEIVRYSRTITGLTGGGSTKLDGVVTAGGSFGAVEFFVGDEYQAWRLVASTHAEDGVGWVRPDDYDASTNAYVWARVR